MDKDPTGGTSKYVATALGKAIVSAAVPPDEGITLYRELDKARKGGLLLENDLHLLYQVQIIHFVEIHFSKILSNVL